MFLFFKYMYMGKLINMDKIYCTNVNNKWDISFSNHIYIPLYYILLIHNIYRSVGKNKHLFR